MAAAPDPMVDVMNQLATLTAANAALQGQVTNLQPVVPAPAPITFARTPALMGQTNLLDFKKKADLSVYAEGKSPVFEGDERFDIKSETLGPFLKRLHKKATDQGWNDPNNAQQIVLFDITHNGATIKIDITKSYGRINLTELKIQCERFMTGVDAQHRANQNNQMMQESIWGSLTMRAQQSLSQYEPEYIVGGVICGPLLLKVIIRSATMDSRSTISILRAQLNDIDSFAAGVSGDVEKITEFFTDNLDRLNASGANLDDEVDVLFKGLKAVPCEEFRSYILRKEELYTDGTLNITAKELAIVAQQRYALLKTKGTFMKSQTIDHEIVAMRAEMVDLKGKLALSKNVEQAGTDKKGDDTKKKKQKKDEEWKRIPPKAGEPVIKQIRNKDFHWCEHHMAWTVHRPSDCRLSGSTQVAGSATPTNANPSPNGVTAASATFTAESILGMLGSSLGALDDSDY